jgi:hypothetical protein
MARLGRKALADMRALEEEAVRVNPIRGRGATPSMGLSQHRGGARHRSPSDEGEHLEGGGFLSDLGIPILSPLAGAIGLGTGAGTGAGMLGQDGHGQRVVGAGTKKGQPRKTARKAFEGLSEAGMMGQHLGKHLHSLHGAGFFDDFAKGFMSVIQPVANIASTAMKVAPLLGLGRDHDDAVSDLVEIMRAGRQPTAAEVEAIRVDNRLNKKEILGAMKEAKETVAAAGTLVQMKGRGKAEDKEAGLRAAVMMLQRGATDTNVVAVLKKSPFYLTKKEAEEVLADAKAAHGLVHMKGGVRTGAYEGKGKASRAKKAQKIGEMELKQHEMEHEALEGGGFLSDLGIPVISQLAGAIGLGKEHEMEGCGTGAGTGAARHRRRPAGADDKRRQRAAIVKRVMQERGCSLPEASRIVKAEGLF